MAAQENRRKKTIFTYLLLLFNLAAIAGLVLVYIAARIKPTDFWPIAFVGLTYPLMLVINLFFVVWWLVRRRWYFMFSVIIILLGWGHLTGFVSWRSASRKLPENGNVLSIASYNVKVFDLYSYGPRWEFNFTNRNNIFRFLQARDYDIICFQEYFYDKQKLFRTTDTLKTLLRAKYVHQEFSRENKGINFFGVATFSAYPIIKTGRVPFPRASGNLCIYTDIKVNDDTIRVYNAHFESIGLGSEDYVFLSKIAETDNIMDRDYLSKNTKRILRRMKRAFIERTAQIENVKEHIRNSPYPVILAGDFNDTPSSWSYQYLTRDLKDSFRSGKGIGQTYNGTIPGFRIDYILHSKDFKAYNFHTGRQPYSDHFPVWTWLHLPKKNGKPND